MNILNGSDIAKIYDLIFKLKKTPGRISPEYNKKKETIYGKVF